MLKVLMVSIFIFLFTSSSFAENCVVSAALKDQICSTGYFKAKNQNELDDYLLNGKFTDGKLLNLEISFNVKEKEIDIATTCDLKISHERGLFAKQDGICLQGSSIFFEGGNQIRADEKSFIKITADKSVIFRKSHIESKDGDLNISTNNFLPFDGEVLILEESHLKVSNISINSKSNLIINSESKLQADKIILNGGFCEIAQNEKSYSDNDKEKEHRKVHKFFSPKFIYSGTCKSNPLPSNLEITPTVSASDSQTISFSVLGAPSVSTIKWRFDQIIESIDSIAKHNFAHPGKHIAQAIVIGSGGYFRKISKSLSVSPVKFNKGQIAVFQFVGSSNAPKKIQALVDMKIVILTKLEQDPELYFTEMSIDNRGVKNILVPYFNYQGKFTLNVLPLISNPAEYIDQRFDELEAVLGSINSTNQHVLNLKHSINLLIGELRIKVNALPVNDRIKLANFLLANALSGVNLTTNNQKTKSLNILDFFFARANADVFSFLQDNVTVQKLVNFGRIGLGVVPFIVSSGAIAIGVNLARFGPTLLERIEGIGLAVGGAVALLFTTLDAIAQTSDMHLPKKDSLFGQVLGQALSGKTTKIRLRGKFIPVDSLPIRQVPLVLNATNISKNENFYISKANKSIDLFNNSLGLLNLSSPIEQIPLVTFPQTKVPGFLSSNYITSVSIISPLDESALIQSYSPNGSIINVVIKSNKSQIVRIKLIYANSALGVNRGIIVDVPVIAEPPKAIITITSKNNLQVNFASTGNIDTTGLTYAWSFGDGQSSALKNPSHTYSQTGTYPVFLTVSDAFGGNSTAQASVQVTGPYVPPPITRNLDASFLNYSNKLELTAYAKMNMPDLTYSWDFGDGTGTFSGTPFTHSYATPGVYVVALKVSDQNGNEVSSDKSVFILGDRPTVSHITSAREVTFTLTDSFNVEGTSLRYLWTFGDGETLTTTDKEVTHSYPDLLSKQVSVKLVDTNSNELYQVSDYLYDRSNSNLLYFIVNRKVGFTLESIVGYEDANVTYKWNFGDGQKTTTTDPTTVHEYSNEGAYKVTVNVYDENGTFLFNEVSFILADYRYASYGGRPVDGPNAVTKEEYLARLPISPTSKEGFIYETYLDNFGTCYSKGVDYFSDGGVRFIYLPLYNCTVFEEYFANF